MKKETSNQPDYYKKYKIDPLIFIMENNLDFVQGCVIKYIMRYKDKNGTEDLRKIINYIERLIRKIEQDNAEFLPVCYDFFEHDFEEEKECLEDKKTLTDCKNEDKEVKKDTTIQKKDKKA